MTETDEKKVKTLSTEELQDFQEALKKTGILYMSRVPPFMKPMKVRQLLSQYGEVGRIYLAPEDDHSRKKRVKLGGNRRKMYTEGWIEFRDKNVAKMLAKTLNAQPIGGKKRGFYREELWTLKYLPKFKWNHLNERIAYERASRDERIRTEMAQAKLENAAFVENVARAKMIESIQERRKKKAISNETTEKVPEVRRVFHQRGVKTIQAKTPLNSSSTAMSGQLSSEFKSVLEQLI